MADDEQVIEEAGRGTHWLTWALYAGLIGVNAWLVYDAYPKPNPVSDFVAKVKAKGEGCEGCARRKAAMRSAMNRMHWDAERAVDGEDIDTVPDVVPPS
jgi:hypothetical protein